MTHLGNLFSLTYFHDLIRDGYLAVEDHPRLPFRIVTTTERTEDEQAWTPVTRQCQGLIYNRDTLGVVARPRPKVFDCTHPMAPIIESDDYVVVTELKPGLEALLYFDELRLPIFAVDGHLNGPDVEYATRIYDMRYHGTWKPYMTHTYLFAVDREHIIENLVAVGSVDIDTGKFFEPDMIAARPQGWPGSHAEVRNLRQWRNVIADMRKPEAKDLIVHHLRTGHQVVVRKGTR